MNTDVQKYIDIRSDGTVSCILHVNNQNLSKQIKCCLTELIVEKVSNKSMSVSISKITKDVSEH